MYTTIEEDAFPGNGHNKNIFMVRGYCSTMLEPMEVNGTRGFLL